MLGGEIEVQSQSLRCEIQLLEVGVRLIRTSVIAMRIDRSTAPEPGDRHDPIVIVAHQMPAHPDEVRSHDVRIIEPPKFRLTFVIDELVGVRVLDRSRVIALDVWKKVGVLCEENCDANWIQNPHQFNGLVACEVLRVGMIGSAVWMPDGVAIVPKPFDCIVMNCGLVGIKTENYSSASERARITLVAGLVDDETVLIYHCDSPAIKSP